MKNLGALLVVLSLPMSAHADIAPSGALSVGATVGAHDHPDDAGATIGADLDAELRFGMFTVGGSIGVDAYAVMDGVPVSARTIAGRAGIALPFSETPPNGAHRIIRLAAIGALEGGVHRYSPAGDRSHFLGGTTTYVGDTDARMFGGIRAGIEMTFRRPQSTSAVLLKVELIGRRDLHSAELEYDKVSCGGLFVAENDCSDPAHGMIQVGGSELGVTTSIGVQFGGP